MMKFNFFNIDGKWVMNRQKYFPIDLSQCNTFLTVLSQGSKWITLTLVTKKPDFYHNKLTLTKKCTTDKDAKTLNINNVYIDLSNNCDNIAGMSYANLIIPKDYKIDRYIKNIKHLYITQIDRAFQNHVQ